VGVVGRTVEAVALMTSAAAAAGYSFGCCIVILGRTVMEVRIDHEEWGRYIVW